LLVSILFYSIAEPPEGVDLTPAMAFMLLFLALPAWWALMMVLVYLVLVINNGWGWLTRKPVLKSPPIWIQSSPLTLRQEVIQEAKLSLWFLAACVALGVMVAIVKSIVGAP